MKSANPVFSLTTALALAAILGSMPALTRAAQTDLAQAPLATAPSATVLPNLMFILDDSTSMGHRMMPEEVFSAPSCKTCTATSCNVAAAGCDNNGGDPPFYASAFNTIYYNPQITYSPGVNADGTSKGNANPTSANTDPYVSGLGTKNMETGRREAFWCDNSGRSGDDLFNSNFCKRNGIHTSSNPFVLKGSNAANDNDFSGGFPNTKFRFRKNKDVNPQYYDITPREHCTDARLTECVLSATPTAKHPVPALVRWCRADGLTIPGAATFPGPVTGNGNGKAEQTAPDSPLCRATVDTTYKFPRLGNLKRTDIVPATGTYGGRFGRVDCTDVALGNCTYTEELQNYANWYSYYHTRLLTMKTVAGRAFTMLDDRYRVGFVTINATDDTGYLKIDKFTPAHKVDWYKKFYDRVDDGGTPLRQALSKVGRHYAGKTDGINSFMAHDPVQFSCQQNFALLTTDGYWKGAAGVQLDGTSAIGNQDNVDSGFSKREGVGAFDGGLTGTAGGSPGGSSDTLADVAMYYYKTDLRPSGPLSKDNVPTTDKDKAAHQHMVTFTLGLGLDGLMVYRPDYETATTGDFAKVKAGDSSGCPWTTGVCNWPQVIEDTASALDDLWHAAVNGRGIYFNAKDPNSLQSGLASTFAALKQITTGAAASSATSTPNITPTDNFIYSSTYRTVKWDGEVVAEKINTSDGSVLPGVVWSASGQLDTRVSAATDTRTIYTFTTVFSNNRKDFTYANMSDPQKAHFDNKGSLMPQFATLTAPQKTAANDGNNLIKWLRGQTGNEGTLYRDREHVLADVINGKPAYVPAPNLLFGSTSYGAFKTANAGRQPVLYIPGNGGMLHAFNADTGAEMWAWVPRMLWPELYKLASASYDLSHRYYVDGSPVATDVFIDGAWKTILVGSLNAGGRGYYAIDITNPSSPKGLWEVCADPTGTLQCTDDDDNIGFTFGQPIITKDPLDNKWVVIVSSGYNNVSPGDGKGYIFIINAETGIIKAKIDTNVGSATTPSGLAKISGFATNFTVDNTTTVVYGGDLFGNVWSFDVENRVFKLIGETKDASGKMQSITTRPEVTEFDAGFKVVYVATGRFLGVTDIPDPALPPLSATDRAFQQSVYGFKDTGANLGNLRLAGANLVPQTLSVLDASTRTISNTAVDWSTKNGWFVDLNPANESPGERANIDPQLVKGVLIVSTNEPNSDACSTGGDSFLYQFDYRSGSYIASSPQQVVGIKLGSALAAGFVVYRLPSGQLKYTSIDVTGKKLPGPVNPGAGGSVGSRVSWRELYQ